MTNLKLLTNILQKKISGQRYEIAGSNNGYYQVWDNEKSTLKTMIETFDIDREDAVLVEGLTLVPLLKERK